MDKTDKLKLLDTAVVQINKDYGEHSVMSLNEKPATIENIISSGSLNLDYALGVGGFPKGRIIEIYGPESSGKTTIAIHAIAEAQKKGGVAFFVDAEHSFDKEYARNLGVDVDELRISQPDYGERALEIADKVINSGGIDVIVIDSVAALVPKAELEGEMGDSKMGLQARMMGQALRKLSGAIYKNNVLCIFINQTREKIGVMYGSPITTSGGNALKFFASIRLDVSKSLVKEGDTIVAHRAKVKVIKNKVAPPFKVAEFDLIFGEGIDKAGEIVDAGIEHGIIKKGGSWLTYEDVKVQGKNSFRQMLKDNPDFMKEIENKIKEIIYA